MADIIRTTLGPRSMLKVPTDFQAYYLELHLLVSIHANAKFSNSHLFVDGYVYS